MSEHNEQTALFQWSAIQARQTPELALLFAIPNGGHRHKAVAKKLRDEGVKAGVPDIYLPVAKGGYHGLFIEMKYGRNKPTEAQIEWIAKLREQGYRAVVCTGWDEARTILVEYLEIE